MKMEKRRIKLEDGRYLIFYTFIEEPAAGRISTGDMAATGSAAPAPGLEPQAPTAATGEERE